MFTEHIAALGTGAAQWLYAGSGAIRTMLEDYTVSHAHMADVIANLNHLAEYFMAGICVYLAIQCCRSNAQIAVNKDHVQVAATDTGQGITDTHPVGIRQRMPRQVAYL
jgi:hypothetical protein